MASKASKENKQPESSNLPKHKQLIQMLSFRVVPAYYKEIEKVADKKSCFHSCPGTCSDYSQLSPGRLHIPGGLPREVDRQPGSTRPSPY